MPATEDLVVHARDRTPQLIVETKTKTPASADWAMRLRRNMFAHLRLPHAPFFLVALPERFYLWKNAPSHDAIPPDYEIDARQVLQPYLEKLNTPLSALSGYSFGILVRSWLDDVISKPDSSQLAPSDQWLVGSGLYDAIKQGSIKTQEHL
jgi:hypothetical protein